MDQNWYCGLWLIAHRDYSHQSVWLRDPAADRLLNAHHNCHLYLGINKTGENLPCSASKVPSDIVASVSLQVYAARVSNSENAILEYNRGSNWLCIWQWWVLTFYIMASDLDQLAFHN
jgi:hypothetical protein